MLNAGSHILFFSFIDVVALKCQREYQVNAKELMQAAKVKLKFSSISIQL